MEAEMKRLDARKAMAYDLFNIIDGKPEKEAYTPEEIKKIIRVYIAADDQK